MSIFRLSNGQMASPTGGNFDISGGNDFTVIPEDTLLKVVADEARWEDGAIKIRWSVLTGEFANRKIYHAVRIADQDQEKADRHKKMLRAIDENCGGGLGRLNREPSDSDLSALLLSKPMLIVVGTWEWQGKEGNWVKAVSSAKSQQPVNSYAEDIPF